MIIPWMSRSRWCTHADLSREEQAIVEKAYCCGAICVLVATSTMAAGVNLPARHVLSSIAGVMLLACITVHRNGLLTFRFFVLQIGMLELVMGPISKRQCSCEQLNVPCG